MNSPSTPKSSPSLRVLHVGNIANNAYNNAKIQRRFGIEADVICYDYYHLMSCPEWEDSGFTGTISDPFRPDWWSVDLNGFNRPDWFAQGPVSHCRKYLNSRNRGSPIRKYWHFRMTFSRWLFVCKSPFSSSSSESDQQVKSMGDVLLFLRFFLSQSYWIPRNLAVKLTKSTVSRWKYAESLAARSSYLICRKIWRLFRYSLLTRVFWGLKKATRVLLVGILHLVGVIPVFIISAGIYLRILPPDIYNAKIERLKLLRRQLIQIIDSFLGAKTAKTSIRLENRQLDPQMVADAQQYLGDIHAWQDLYSQYDIIQAYSVDPIRPFLSNLTNFAAYEHGTIREIPFVDNALGRLTKASYQSSPIVFVTNSDNITAVDRLGLRPDQVVYLPHAFDETKLIRFKEEHINAIALDQSKIVLFSPARQHWRDNNPSMSKRNDRFLRAFATACALDSRLHAKLVAWGEDLDRSKDLIEQLGMSDRVTWVAPFKKRELWMEYLNCHAVVDQFLIPAIGGVAFEAMTLGKRVLTSIDLDQNIQFFGKEPAMLYCSSEKEILSRIKQVLADPLDVQGIGIAATEWMLNYHSSERVFDLQMSAYQKILEDNNTIAPLLGKHATNPAPQVV